MRNHPLPLHTAGWFLALCLVSPLTQADTLFSIKTENDAYAGAGDGHYTNGFEMSWAFETEADHLEPWHRPRRAGLDAGRCGGHIIPAWPSPLYPDAHPCVDTPAR